MNVYIELRMLCVATQLLTMPVCCRCEQVDCLRAFCRSVKVAYALFSTWHAAVHDCHRTAKDVLVVTDLQTCRNRC
jgi:hypothetical protein